MLSVHPEWMSNQVKPVKVAVDNYLQNFRQTEFVETSWKTDGCPENLSATPLKQVKALTSELSDIKIAQASLIKKLKGPSRIHHYQLRQLLLQRW